MDEKEMKKNGENMKSSSGIKLPIGYRFRPTDEELVVHYLKRKVFGFPLPASIIPDLHHHLLFHSHPLSLPAGDMKEKKRYFFGNITNNAATYYKKVAVAASASVVGYWKGIGKNRQIFADHNKQQLVGLRKSFIFCDNNKTTQWVMHQYFLVATIATTVPNSPNNDDSVANCKMVIIGDWAVYRIFQRKKRLIRNINNNRAVSSYNNNNNNNEKKMKKMKNQLQQKQPADSASSTSTSCTSEITAVDQFLSPSVLDDQEATSSNGACSVFSKY